MARGRISEYPTILRMALVGYEIERHKIEEKIRDLQSQLKGEKVALAPGGPARKNEGVKRVLSPAARKRISLAQKRRWAEHRKRQATAAKSA